MKYSEDKIIEAIQTAEQFVEIMTEADMSLPLEDFPKVEVFLKTNKKALRLVTKLIDEKNYAQQIQPDKSEIDKLLLSFKKKERSRRKMILSLKLVGSVAAVAILSFVLFYAQPVENVDHPSIRSSIDKPTIILSNGKNISVKQGTLIKAEDYNKKMPVATQKLEYNTLVVPHKYTTEVLLEDGTKVTLNANSELKYPTKFTGNKREVFLKGEAFFEVTKNETPFIVSTQDMDVKVYGTKFNVSTMRKNFTEALLLSGSIGVTVGSDDEVMIKPNQLFSFDRAKEKYEVREIDPSTYLTWMSDYIGCHKESLGLFLERITNWYGVDFSVSEEVNLEMNVTFSLHKQLSIDDFLSIVEGSIDVKFIKEKNNKYRIKGEGGMY